MNAQTYTINFQNNNLSGTTNFLEGYKSSKTRICVTVGMMTVSYTHLGMKFLTYAAPAIRNAMTDCIRAAFAQFEQRMVDKKDGLGFQRVYLDDVLSELSLIHI